MEIERVNNLGPMLTEAALVARSVSEEAVEQPSEPTLSGKGFGQ